MYITIRCHRAAYGFYVSWAASITPSLALLTQYPYLRHELPGLKISNSRNHASILSIFWHSECRLNSVRVSILKTVIELAGLTQGYSNISYEYC